MRSMRGIIITWAAFCILAAPVSGQDQAENKNVTSSDVRRESKDAAKTTGTYLHQKKDQYQKRAEEKLNRLEDKVKRLYVRAEKKSVRAKEKISRAATDLKKKSESAKSKLKDLKESGEEKWENARAELDAMLKDLERSYSRTVARFKD